MTEAEELARRVRAARAYAGITQEDLSARLGVSVVTYKRIEAGRRDISLEEVRRVSEITEMPVAFFTDDISSLSGSGSSQELEDLRGQLSGLVDRLADIEWQMRRNVRDAPSNEE